MRLLCVTLCLGGLWSGSAAASSFVTLPAEAVTISRSMVLLGAPAQAVEAKPDKVRGLVIEGRPIPEIALTYPGLVNPELATSPNVAPAPYTMLSPSVIALGEPAPAEDGLRVENMNVAAIGGEAPSRGPRFAPMVIRGGISGDAFARAASEPSIEAEPSGPEQISAAPTRDNPGPAAPEPMPTPAPPPPAPAAPAVQKRLPQ